MTEPAWTSCKVCKKPITRHDGYFKIPNNESAFCSRDCAEQFVESR